MEQYKKIYEFLVWDNCNNNCKFCFQREHPRLFNKEKRQNILNETIKFIQCDKFIKGSHILICGGEIFDKPSDFEVLDSFFCKILEFMVNGTIDLLYINTNLIYKDLTGVIRFIRRIQTLNLFDRLKFTTSYDLEGRFKSKDDEKLMLSNLKLLTGVYKDLKVVSNTILTKPVCESIIKGTFSVKKFMEDYHCWVNLIPYIVLDETLTPTRTEIFTALKRVDDECPGYLQKYVPNMAITQEKWLYMYKDNGFKFCSCEIDPICGHSINFKRYSSSGTCFCCDIKEVFNDKI